MKRFFLFCVAYYALAVFIVLLTRENPSSVLLASASATLVRWLTFLHVVSEIILIMIVVSSFTKLEATRERIFAILIAFLGALFFHTGFSLIKTSMPNIVPFYADPFFANIDKQLHGGIDPWYYVHNLAKNLPMEWLMPFYLKVWIIPAFLLPTIVVAFDDDKFRVRRILILFVFSWVVIGNVVALLGMSVGPVFYDRLLEVTRFAGLTEVLISSGVTASNFGAIHEFLWMIYSERGQALGSGISAFPSVHVSIATCTGLYLFERSKWLAPIGLIFVLIILFLSVYIGFHYAVDGYVSIILVVLAWYALKRNDERTSVELLPQ